MMPFVHRVGKGKTEDWGKKLNGQTKRLMVTSRMLEHHPFHTGLKRVIEIKLVSVDKFGGEPDGEIECTVYV